MQPRPFTRRSQRRRTRHQHRCSSPQIPVEGSSPARNRDRDVPCGASWPSRETAILRTRCCRRPSAYDGHQERPRLWNPSRGIGLSNHLQSLYAAVEYGRGTTPVPARFGLPREIRTRGEFGQGPITINPGRVLHILEASHPCGGRASRDMSSIIAHKISRMLTR